MAKSALGGFFHLIKLGIDRSSRLEISSDFQYMYNTGIADCIVIWLLIKKSSYFKKGKKKSLLYKFARLWHVVCVNDTLIQTTILHHVDIRAYHKKTAADDWQIVVTLNTCYTVLEWVSLFTA